MESGIRGADGRLVTAQQALAEQEVRYRASEKEKTLLGEKLNSATKQLSGTRSQEIYLELILLFFCDDDYRFENICNFYLSNVLK